jgi:hypothetical protein
MAMFFAVIDISFPETSPGFRLALKPLHEKAINHKANKGGQ